MFRSTNAPNLPHESSSHISFAIASVWLPPVVLIVSRLATLNIAPPKIASYWQPGSSLPVGFTTPAETFLYALIVATIGAMIGTVGVLSPPFDAKGEFSTIVGGGLSAVGSATYLVFVEMTRLHGDPTSVRLGPWALIFVLLFLWGLVPDRMSKKQFLRFNASLIGSHFR